MRVTSGFWVGAYLRRMNGLGLPAVLTRRGSEEAGAILIRVDRLDGTADLYGPAPQSSYGPGTPDDRLFAARFPSGPQPADRIGDAIASALRFDPDLWLVDVEDRAGRHGLGQAVVA